MRTRIIIRIARVELSNLFYSPIAWLLLVVFFIQVTLAYVAKVEAYVTAQETGRPLIDLTNKMFASAHDRGIFISTVLSNLYLYIPLITMGLISREKSSGTFKLLYSSPIKLIWVVLGKYSAMLVFNLVMVVALLVIAVFASWTIGSLDWGMVWPGLFGIFLLLGAYAAIGLFLSCLSSYQVVAAIATFGVFALFRYVGELWQEYDVVRDLTAYLSISGRTETMISGLITTRDVLYYILISVVFLIFAGLKLRAERVKERRLIAGMRYGLAVGIVLIVGYITSLPGYIGYWDTTDSARNTLSTTAQNELAELDGSKLLITSYINLIDPTYFRARPRDRKADEKRWERYQRFKPDIRLKYAYYYDSTRSDYVYNQNKGLALDGIAEKFAKAHKTDLDRYKAPDQIRKEVDLYPEKNRLVRRLEYQGKSTFLRTFDDNEFWPSETETIAALRRLTRPLPRIGFLQGEQERSIDRMGDRHFKLATSEVNVRLALINQGFNVERITSSDEIPSGLAALVIADPRTDFTFEVQEKIERYINGGGNIWFAGEPGKQDILNPLLKRLGVQLNDGMIIQGNTSFAPDEVTSYVTATGLDFGSAVSLLYGKKMPISTPSAVGIQYTDTGRFTIRELLRTKRKDTWLKTGKVVLDSADIKFNRLKGDVKEAIPTAVALTRQVDDREQRILVTGDADFLSNAVVSKRYPSTGNADFFQGFLGWFTYGRFPADPMRPYMLDSEMTIKGSQTGLLRWVMLGLIPGIIIFSGSVLLVRRRRK